MVIETFGFLVITIPLKSKNRTDISHRQNGFMQIGVLRTVKTHISIQ